MVVEDVSPLRARKLISSRLDFIVLDVRAYEEFAEGHIEGAVSVPPTDLQVRVFDFDPDRPILVYCHSGNTSQGACSLLEEHGFALVYHLHGGFEAWLKEGLPISKLNK